MVTKSPKIGDIVCYDENRKVKFIALDTFHAGTFPAAWETVGVVVLRKGPEERKQGDHLLEVQRIEEVHGGVPVHSERLYA